MIAKNVFNTFTTSIIVLILFPFLFQARCARSIYYVVHICHTDIKYNFTSF